MSEIESLICQATGKPFNGTVALLYFRGQSIKTRVTLEVAGREALLAKDNKGPILIFHHDLQAIRPTDDIKPSNRNDATGARCPDCGAECFLASLDKKHQSVYCGQCNWHREWRYEDGGYIRQDDREFKEDVPGVGP